MLHSHTDPIIGVLFVACLILNGCRRSTTVVVPDAESTGPAWFEDITDASGVTFVHDPGPIGHYFMPQIMGAGVALFDYDNDGRLDILLLQSGGPDSKFTHRLFHQEKDGTFTDVSKGSGLDVAGFGTGVAIGDVNNDGWPDVLITEYGGLRLFLNNGNGTFTDVTRSAGLTHLLWGTSACFVDYDRDGWLDLVVINYVQYDSSKLCYDSLGKRDYCHPGSFPGSVTKLFHNLGPQKDGKTVRFEDVTEKAGLGIPGPGLGVACADFNGDGWPDILVANDGQPNRLWINQKNGTFKDEAVTRGLAYNNMGQAQANMGIGLGDIDGDGRLDVFITHLAQETNTLWLQETRGQFHDRTVPSGLAGPGSRGTGFGTVLADFDHDGSLDVAVVNGRVYHTRPVDGAKLDDFWNPYAERNRLFAGEGAGRFRDISSSNPAICGTPGIYRGLACGDLNGDGALDLLVTTVGGSARIYRNVAPQRGHWLIVRAVDPALKRDAYGAEITVVAGTRRWLGLVQPGLSYQCSHDPRVHFGLGAKERVDAIQVHWPNGDTEVFPAQATDRRIELFKGQGTKE